MATLTASTTSCTLYQTEIKREVPVFRSVGGTGSNAVTNVDLSIQLYNGETTTTTFSYTVYLFKTFNDSTGWQNRKSSSGNYDYDSLYQYPQNGSYYLNTSHIGDILAQKSVSTSLASKTNTTINVTDLTITDYGKTLSNWSGDIGLGIIYDHNQNFQWKKGGTHTLSLTSSSGIIRYAVGGSYVNCEVYYATGGSFVKVKPYYATGNSFVELG